MVGLRRWVASPEANEQHRTPPSKDADAKQRHDAEVNLALLACIELQVMPTPSLDLWMREVRCMRIFSQDSP
jgi:hypothetical protein